MPYGRLDCLPWGEKNCSLKKVLDLFTLLRSPADGRELGSNRGNDLPLRTPFVLYFR